MVPSKEDETDLLQYRKYITYVALKAVRLNDDLADTEGVELRHLDTNCLKT